MTHELSPLKHLYYRFLGKLYYWAYRSLLRRFLGIPWADWLRFITLLLIPALWIVFGRFPLLITLFAIYVRYTYYRAKQVGYSRFIPDNSEPMALPDVTPLPPNTKVSMRATGVFSLSDREDQALLRPAEYWQMPRGSHALMVEHAPEHYRYQFFQSSHLVKVQTGWLIFGDEPLDALAITFKVTWGPDYTRDNLLYFVGGGQDEEPSGNERTIYLTFSDEDSCRRVLHNIVHDARQSRLQTTPTPQDTPK